MKTKFKCVTLLAAALLVGFTSCSNDDEPGVNPAGGKAEKSVFVKVSSGSATTYADQATASGSAATLSGAGYIFFLQANGTVEKEIAIVATGTSNQNQITVTDLTGAGYEITGVSNQVADVYVVGNTTATLTGLTSKALIEATLLSITDQTTTVTLQGTGAIIPTAVSGKSEAIVRVSPVVARFEVAQVEYDAADPTSAANLLTAYDVEGIFVNNVYTQMGLNFTALPANLLYKGPASSADFTAAFFPNPLSDIAASLGGAALTKTPTSGVWGYHFFPVEKTTTNNVALPDMVIKLGNIADAASAITGTQWVTVKQFENTTAPGVALEKFERNKIYKIASIKFANKHLSPVPSTVNSDVTISVTVESWVDVNVNPVLP